MSKENNSFYLPFGKFRKSSLLQQLRADIPKDVLDIIESSIIDASKLQLIPVNTIFVLSVDFGIKFESIHLDGAKDVSPSESLLLNLLYEVEKEVENQKNVMVPNTRPNYLSEHYDSSDPLSIHNWLIAYSKDMRWIEVGDYLMTLHQDKRNSPYHLDYQDLRFMKNGRMIKLFNFHRDNLEMYLADLCVYLSSYSNTIRWSYR
jgi:hypothetical protein